MIISTGSMKPTGLHLLAEYHGCDPGLLDDVEAVSALMSRAAEAAGATVVASTFHRFSPQGVTGVAVLEESHLSIHTWPEHGYAAVDFFTCGECTPGRAHELLSEELGAERAEVMEVRRGGYPPGQSMEVVHHAWVQSRVRWRLDTGPGSGDEG